MDVYISFKDSGKLRVRPVIAGCESDRESQNSRRVVVGKVRVTGRGG